MDVVRFEWLLADVDHAEPEVGVAVLVADHGEPLLKLAREELLAEVLADGRELVDEAHELVLDRADLKSLFVTCFVRKYAYIVLPSSWKSWSYSMVPFMSNDTFFEMLVHA